MRQHTPAPLPLLQPRRLSPGQGWRWIAGAFALYRTAPISFSAMALLWFLMAVAVSFIPLLGGIAVTVLSPVLFGGFMIAADLRSRGVRVGVGALFAAFSGYGGPLALVGLVYLGGLIAVTLLAVLLAILFGLSPADPVAPVIGDPALAATVVVSWVLWIPLLMALWYAPALVVLEQRPPAAAMRLSLQGAVRNLPAFLVFLLIGVGLSVVAAIPLLLGFLIWAPVVLLSAYTGYRDIYVVRDEAAAPLGQAQMSH
jgi:hypothetical protein